MDRRQAASEHDVGRDSAEGSVRPAVTFPHQVRRILRCPSSLPAERIWDAFLGRFGDLILKTATVAQRSRGLPERRRDAAMDAYTRILERLREDGFRRLEAFPGGEEEDLRRWLVVVGRRICTDLFRERYGRARGSTSDLHQGLRRRLVDELWETRSPDELPAGTAGNPELAARRGELLGALEAALETVDPRSRLLLAFRFEDGLSARRIAELMGLPSPFHVYRRLNKLLASLRADLEARGVRGPDP